MMKTIIFFSFFLSYSSFALETLKLESFKNIAGQTLSNDFQIESALLKVYSYSQAHKTGPHRRNMDCYKEVQTTSRDRYGVRRKKYIMKQEKADLSNTLLLSKKSVSFDDELLQKTRKTLESKLPKDCKIWSAMVLLFKINISNNEKTIYTLFQIAKDDIGYYHVGPAQYFDPKANGRGKRYLKDAVFGFSYYDRIDWDKWPNFW